MTDYDIDVAERLQLRAMSTTSDDASRRLLRALADEPHALLTETLDALGLQPGKARDRVGFALANCDGVTLSLIREQVVSMRTELDLVRLPVEALLSDGVRSVTSAGERLHVQTDDQWALTLRVVVESAVKR